MKPLRRHKQYKNCEPKDTIATIQGILKDKLDIGVCERAFQERNGLFHSCRIVLDNGDWLRSVNIGTNGKGMTEDYSRASAHGELMERLQNGTLLRFQHFATRHFLERYKERFPLFYEQLTRHDVVLPCRYAHDEEESASDQRLEESIGKHVRTADNRRLYELAKGHAHYYVPYYSVTGHSVERLPYDIISNSISTNGLCAGNTPKEALIEGLCEILERYVIRKIYFDNLSLPKIPRSYFRGNEIIARIEELERRELYTIDIVDCSLGVGIPAVGVIVVTAEKAEYQFHMGVDPSPITALERSMTELFQGRDAIKFKRFDLGLQEKLNTDIDLKEFEMHKTNSSSIGHFPLAFFNETPSYAFAGFDAEMGLSDDTDLALLVGLVRRLGFSMYVRDNSFLGFPAYSIYIPGMSELHNTHSLRYFEATYGKYEDIFLQSHHLRTIGREETELMKLLESTPDNSAMLNFVNEDDVWEKAPYYLLSILHYRAGDRQQAASYMETFANMTFPGKGLNYNWCLFDALSSVMADDNYRWQNSNMGWWWMSSGIIEEMEKPDFFAHYSLPKVCGEFSNCFDCDTCPLKDRCNYIPYLKMVRRLYRHAEETAINQQDLSSVFQ